ncbi:MAG: tetratricopeptide repeat protein [Elainellaceae cyanobacterium]
MTSLLGVPPFWTTMGFMAFNARPIALLFGIFAGLFLVRALVRHLRRPADVWVNSLDLLGWLMLRLRQPSAALKCYRQAVRLDPQAHGGVWTNLGSTLYQLQRYEEAIAAFEQGLAVDPHYSDPGFNQGSHQLWLGRGLSLMQLHRDEEALNSFQRALEMQPDFFDAASMKVCALQRLKQTEEALAECDRLLTDSTLPTSFQRQMRLLKSELLIDLGRHEEALEIFEQYSQKQPQSASEWHDRGLMLAKLQRPDEALDAFETALQRSPKFRLGWRQKGWLLFNLKRYDEALDCCQRSQRWLGQDPGMLNIRGATLTRLGRTEEAIAAYDRAVHIQPQNADNWYNRGCYYAEVGDAVGAIANLRHAISLSPKAAVNAQSDESFDRIRHHSEFQSLYNGADHEGTTRSTSDRSD